MLPHPVIIKSYSYLEYLKLSLKLLLYHQKSFGMLRNDDSSPLRSCLSLYNSASDLLLPLIPLQVTEMVLQKNYKLSYLSFSTSSLLIYMHYISLIQICPLILLKNTNNLKNILDCIQYKGVLIEIDSR